MKTLLKVTAILAAISTCSSCTVMFYRLRSPSPVEGPTGCPGGPVTSFQIVQRGGAPPAGSKAAARWEKDEQRLARITREMLAKRGCAANEVRGGEETTFGVNVAHGDWDIDRPQYWATGLSLGLIPSWGTEKDVWVFTFDDASEGGSRSYSLDGVQMNHLIFTPVFWVSFITTDAAHEYRKALNNYLDLRFHSAGRNQTRLDLAEGAAVGARKTRTRR